MKSLKNDKKKKKGGNGIQFRAVCPNLNWEELVVVDPMYFSRWEIIIDCRRARL